ncbi:MAG: DMT family transporter [Candidatus Dormibacteraeota bacterium]|nr:DMT family transporter [Candidatus Dormibacteraeota bacterium]
MRRGYVALGALALIWGAAFFFIKLGIRDMSPATLVLSRCVLGAFTIGLIFAARRQTPFPTGTRARLLPFLTIAILGSLFPWLAIAFGELSISSALASILNATRHCGPRSSPTGSRPRSDRAGSTTSGWRSVSSVRES